MSFEWIGKTVQKKSDPKNQKNSKKNQSEIALCEQKTTTETEILFKHHFRTLL